MNKIKVFELFAGYGGASFALQKAGINYECVGYSEIDKSAIKIYELNFGKDIKNYGDVTKIDPNKLPDFDLLTGGFPCQPFSVNTNTNARGEKHKAYNLFRDILRIVEIKKPTYLLLENVKGILGKKSEEVYNTLLSELNNKGYDVKVELLNSKDYGTPQNRERVFFICKLGKWGEDEFKLPEKIKLELTVKDILEKNITRREPGIKYMLLNKQINIDKYGKINRLDAILQNPVSKKDSNIAFEILDAPSNVVSRQSDRIYNPTHAPCLTATGKDYLFYVDGEVKVLTPRECFRLMGFFNDEIKLEGLGINNYYKLAGNGWDINLVSKILKEMFKSNKKEIEKVEELIQKQIVYMKCPNCDIVSSIQYNKDLHCEICNYKLF